MMIAPMPFIVSAGRHRRPAAARDGDIIDGRLAREARWAVMLVATGPLAPFPLIEGFGLFYYVILRDAPRLRLRATLAPLFSRRRRRFRLFLSRGRLAWRFDFERLF